MQTRKTSNTDTFNAVLEADTKVISMQQPYPVENTTLTSKQCYVSKGCYINKTFIFCAVHRHKILGQSIFPRSYIFNFNSRIDSL